MWKKQGYALVDLVCGLFDIDDLRRRIEELNAQVGACTFGEEQCGMMAVRRRTDNAS